MLSIDPNSKLDTQLFELIWNNTTDAIFTIGQDGSIMAANPAFEACHHLIIHFGIEGAIYYHKKNTMSKSQLFFLPSAFEGDSIKENQGKMYGLSSCFVAGLAADIALGIKNKEELNRSIREGIRSGIVATQKYFINGFGENVEGNDFPSASIFMEEDHDFIYKENVQDVNIRSTTPDCQSCWYIIKDKTSINEQIKKCN